MKHASVEIVGGTPRVVLHPTAEAALDYAVEIAAENTGYTEDEIRTHLKQKDVHEEGEWAVHLVNATEIKAVGECGVYRICERDPKHKAWGVFSRKTTSAERTPFKLNVITFDFDGAVAHAEGLAKEEGPGKQFIVVGGTSSGDIPDVATL